MFKKDELLSGRISKQEFEEQEVQLRVDLLNAQFDLAEADFSVVIVLGGDDRIGANQVIDRLNEWLDSRHIDTNVFFKRTAEEKERPRFWRYWRVLPADGRTAIFGGAWPLSALSDRLSKTINKKGFEERLTQINTLERELADDGTLILKYWIHLPPAELKKRLKKSKKDPDRSWWREEQDWEVFEKFTSSPKVVREMLETTNTETAPWYVVDGKDDRFRDMQVCMTLLEALRGRLDNPPQPAAAETKTEQEEYPDAVGAVDLSQVMEKDEYKLQLTKYQRRYHMLMRKAHENGVSTVLAFEGWDAGGKGGAIRRLTGALPARSYKVVPIAAPTQEERLHHYLWRFWRYIPKAGNVVIFDRTWYGRVTVERIEGFASDAEWQRAYDEINDFEKQLANRGMVVLKFWLHISPEEQMARFKAREVTPYKKHKITEEDFRNRAKWDDYAVALNELVAKTSKKHAPWHLIPANDKRFARVYILKTVCDALEKALKNPKKD
jgi:polyphosphate:AMP phosphotransferase